MSYKIDYETGKRKEQEILPIIKEYFKRDIQEIKERYAIYDFIDEKYKYELKSRNCNYDTYPTTLISKDKIKKRTIYLFNFHDGLYYIRHKKIKANFEKFECKDFVRNKRLGCNDIKKEYVYIPIEYLKKIN